MATKRNTLWFGFLEAGEKGSFVVRDTTMDTGTMATVYLYNQRKDKILEYRRDIVEPKLRELTEEEAKQVKDIRKAFDKVRSGFTPRSVMRPAPPPRKPRPEPEPDELPDFDDDDDIPLSDDDDEDGDREDADDEDDD